MGELLTFHGKTDGTSLTGDFILYSDYVVGSPVDMSGNPVPWIKLPKGVRAKIWSISVEAGDKMMVILKRTDNVIETPPKWSDVKVWRLASAGELSADYKSRPLHIIDSKAGAEAFKFSWDQSGSASAHVGSITVTIEFDDIE